MATTTFDRPHVQPESTLHMFKSTSRLQCVTSSSPSSLVPSVINMDVPNSTPESPLVPLLAPPPSPTDSNQSNIDHITSLEHSLCSDFVCCGARLPDLHALLEHFEEDHIMVLAPNGKRVYPPEGLRSVPLHPLPTSLRTTPSSSRSSSVLSSPNSPSCPLSPSPSSSGSSSLSDLPVRLHGTFERRKSSIVVAPVYTPFTPSLPIDPAYPYPDATTEIDMPLYDFSQDFYPPYSVQLPASHFDNDDDEDMSDATSATSHPTSPIPTYIYGPDKSHPIAQIPKTVRGQHATGKHGSLDGLKSTLRMSSPKSSKVKNRQTNPSSSSNTRRREKAFRCPTPRCTKSYLNPNGLKYHLEKGTCKIESEYESEAGEESNNPLLPELINTCPPDSPSPPPPSSRTSMPPSPNRPDIKSHPSDPSLAEVGSCSYQQPHTYQQGGVRRHESDDPPSSDSEASLADTPELLRGQSYQQYHQHQHQQYQYPYQYPLPVRPLYPGQITTCAQSSYSPVTVSSHDQ